MSKKNQPSKQIVPGKKDQSHPFALLRQEMNTLFDNFFHGFDIEPSWGRIDTFNPKVDVKETDKNITVSAEIPGMDDKDIDVSLSRDALTISTKVTGAMKTPRTTRRNFHRMNRKASTAIQAITDIYSYILVRGGCPANFQRATRAAVCGANPTIIAAVATWVTRSLLSAR